MMIPPWRKVGELVAEVPGRSRVFEEVGIDYCCGGDVSLADACEAAGVTVEEVVKRLEGEAGRTDEEPDLASMGMGELVEHIVKIHHDYLRSELPRLERLIGKVEAAHGENHPELGELKEEFGRLRAELEEHTAEEEAAIFPAGVRLERGEPAGVEGSLGGLLGKSVREHIATGRRLQKIRKLTDGYRIPEDACNSYRAMLDGLAELERDTHHHIFKENSLLFPRMKSREEEMRG
ncbi:MAG: iron-sulfur cluster repair di-iron protein [Rubrobacteraceae bacterium]|nr:iron-sulfur cluster repair di-iron protein [Rubrobacteraceae bacterium]